MELINTLPSPEFELLKEMEKGDGGWNSASVDRADRKC